MTTHMSGLAFSPFLCCSKLLSFGFANSMPTAKGNNNSQTGRKTDRQICCKVRPVSRQSEVRLVESQEGSQAGKRANSLGRIAGKKTRQAGRQTCRHAGRQTG